MRRLLEGAGTELIVIDQAASMLTEAWTLSADVSLRAEPFGALAYHFGTRRLTFLKRPDLVQVVRCLDGTRDVRAALTEAAVPEERWPAYLQALGRLAEADMIRGPGPVAAHG